MAEFRSEREIRHRRNGGMSSMESRRWVFQNEEDSEVDFEDNDGCDGDDIMLHNDVDSDEEDSLYQKLIRTGPKIDSFGVEALDVPGAQRIDFEGRGKVVYILPSSDPPLALLLVGFTEYDDDASFGKSIFLVCQTLGVVFGDVGTSPLYTFSVMFSRAPVDGNEDIIGALSLVLYTLILIPFIKYILIVLLANDDGEGGTFALYSLICRHAKVSLLPNQLASDTRISSFRLKVPSAELERSLKIKEYLETSLALKKLVLGMVLAGTSMVIADGVVTPAMSDHVVMISVAYLIILFSVQKYGTSKVGLVIGPALFIWFCSLGGIGIYNLVKHDSSVVQAFNPAHIYYYFKRNSYKAWYSLGGCLLCATGSEAMFADLCYFPVRTVQITFVFLVLPCLMLGYMGQAAYLLDNGGDATQAFFSSIPYGAFWPVFLIANIAALIASRTMTTATFSCIKQSTALGCFPRLKIVHTSRKFMGQIYIPTINRFLMASAVILVCTIANANEIGNAYGTLFQLPLQYLTQSPMFLDLLVCVFLLFVYIVLVSLYMNNLNQMHAYTGSIFLSDRRVFQSFYL
ncbi:putative potassium transporter [Helianthus anomalus]